MNSFLQFYYLVKRRDFIKIGAAGIAGLFARCSPTPQQSPIFLHSHASIGHILRGERPDWPLEEQREIPCVVVGAGIAGLSAAAGLIDRGVWVLETEDIPGGTALARNSLGEWLPQGAHYDLEYPAGFGQQAMALLEKAGIVSFDAISQKWSFTDSRYLISAETETLCLENGRYRTGVLPESRESEVFLSAIRKRLYGKIALPTQKSSLFETLHRLTFRQYMQAEGLNPSESLLRAIDYQMRDDYGAGSDEVSAWAGAVYYTARHEGCRLFAPPEGNFYFIKKLLSLVGPQNLHCRMLVMKVEPVDRGFKLLCADTQNQRLIPIRCRFLVYAAPKFTLKYVMPALANSFQNRYAPWITINFVFKGWQGEAYWQNEILGLVPDLIGFVDSWASASPKSGKRVLTAYYCLPPEKRKLLLDQQWLLGELPQQTLRAIELFLDMKLEDRLLETHIRPMGHAMAIPTPVALGVKPGSIPKGMAWAGADCGRLPLMLDALGSGLMACRRIKMS